MKKLLINQLEELERFGNLNDQHNQERSKKMLNITKDTGEFLSVLVKSTNARKVLEIGTSNGYSTLWLADACASTGGKITTIEYSEYKFDLARHNFDKSSLSEYIEQLLGEAGSFLSNTDDSFYDLIFLDSERSEYPDWWEDIKRILRPGGLLIVDNAISHEAEMAPFIELVESDESFSTCLVPVGKGEYLATKSIR